MAQIKIVAPLAANAVYRPAAPIDTGEGVEGVGSADTIRVLVASDQAGQLAIEQSDDGATWYVTLGPVAIAASTQFDGTDTASIYESMVTLRYARPVYVNGAAAQGKFALLANLNQF